MLASATGAQQLVRTHGELAGQSFYISRHTMVYMSDITVLHVPSNALSLYHSARLYYHHHTLHMAVLCHYHATTVTSQHHIATSQHHTVTSWRSITTWQSCIVISQGSTVASQCSLMASQWFIVTLSTFCPIIMLRLNITMTEHHAEWWHHNAPLCNQCTTL